MNVQHRSLMALWIGGAWAFLGCRAASAQTPSFDLVGVAPGTNDSFVTGLSADGRVAAGFSLIPGTGPDPGFVWTRASGRRDFGLEAGLPRITGSAAISGDGVTVVGTANNFRAFRWSGTGTYQELGVLPGYFRSFGEGVNGDGSVVVGRCELNPNIRSQAFRWTAGGGMRGLPYARPESDVKSEATGISRDGSIAVGWSQDGGGFTDAVTWDASGAVHVLPQLPGSPFRGSYAYGINFDGTVVVGVSGLGAGAVMWRNGQIMDLGTVAGYGSHARAVDDEGSVVVGALFSGPDSRAGIWTPDRGMELLSDYLGRYGVTVPEGWTLGDAFSVSGDGRTFAGYALSGNGWQGFVATVPGPGGVGLIGLGLFGLRRRRCACGRCGLVVGALSFGAVDS